MKKLTLYSMLFILLGASAALAEQKEVLLGLTTDFDKETLTIEVASSGCTESKDFRLDFADNVLTVFRTRRDACKAMPGRLSLTYPLREAGIGPHKPFRVGNAFLVNENLAQVVDRTEQRHDATPPNR